VVVENAHGVAIGKWKRLIIVDRVSFVNGIESIHDFLLGGKLEAGATEGGLDLFEGPRLSVRRHPRVSILHGRETMCLLEIPTLTSLHLLTLALTSGTTIS